ncbi:unnamed protein product [Rhizoctonia solani]|uniref:F-box domain-containing protein n=1 Tax=Rhizoctonia solani TaxID=456999 RepID=A0A8H3A6P9_9AGAM|nr:unnamed protein product [Rhizoctonia solani]
MSVSILPHEMLACILGYLPMRDLATVSLLCRTWRDLAFKHLYAYVHISRASHLASLASRVASHNGHGPRSIAAHLKRFRIDNLRSTSHESDVLVYESLVHLELLVPCLAKLRYLEWDAWFAYDAKYLKLFQTHCQSLKGVELIITNLWPAKSDQFKLCFNFSNLSHISITLPGITFMSAEHSSGYLPPLTQLLTACPGLVSLTLKNMPPCPISVVNIVSSLGSNFVFSDLLIFRIHWISEKYQPVGDNINWSNFFSPPHSDSHRLRSFFLRHKGIEDLALGWSCGTSYEERIDPNEIVLLFPSLKRFEGPAFLCNAITKSDIAQNLEVLTIVDPFMENTDWLDTMGGELRSMPKLRSLIIRAHGEDDILDPLVLDNFISAAPGIETLECRPAVHDFVAVLIAISHAPKLRKLVAYGPSWVASALDQEFIEISAGEDWINMISRVAKRCHSLESFENVNGWIGDLCWQIVRDESGKYQSVINVG